jgi:hypothetical protein
MSKLTGIVLVGAVIASLIGPSTASANAINGTTITAIFVNSATAAPQWVTITFSTSGAACVATSAMLIDVSTTKGKALFSLATAALLAHVVVDVTGTSQCQQPAGSFSTEVLSTLNVHNQ